jgi:L-rhamnose mutarotase
MKNLCCLLLFIFIFGGCAGTGPKRMKFYSLTSRDCNVCHRMDNDLDAVEAEYKDTVEVSSYSDTSDTGEDLAKKNNIKRYPGNIFLDENGKLLFKYEGILDKRAMEDILNRILKARQVLSPTPVAPAASGPASQGK